MNILELAGFYSNYGGNFIPALENLDQKLVALGHKTYYIFSNRNQSEKFYEWEKPFSQHHNTLLTDYQSFSFVKDICNFIKENHIDIVHAHFCYSAYLSLIKKLSPSNVVFYQQMHTTPYGNVINWKARAKRVRNAISFDKKITVICVSKAMEPIVKYLFPRNEVITCANCIDLSRFDKRSYNRNPNFRILMLGYNYTVKGVDIAIKGVLKARETIKDMHLDIIMGDNLESNIKRIEQEFGRIPDCISILEPTNNIKPYYQNHTVHLNSSRSEGASFAILEAYYSGALCVLSDVPGTMQYSLPNVILFKSEDVDELAEALLKAYRDKDSYCNDSDYVQNNFSIESWSDNIIRILKLK